MNVNDKYHQEPEIPAWSNPALEDHKFNKLHEKGIRGDAAFFARGRKVFFGDIHVHTNYSRCGRPNNGTVEKNLDDARNAKHDFIAIADHAEHMDDSDYRTYCRIIESANENGRFITLPAYEWASHTFPGNGHRNVYFREKFGPLWRGKDPKTDTPRKLALALRKQKQGVIAPRHHPPYVNDWNNVDDEYEPVIEIYSEWGNSEYEGCPRALAPRGPRRPWPGNYVQDGLIRGHQFGFVAGGDAHNVNPGAHGLTGVYSDDLTRQCVFDAIRNRYCYATTGTRILLDFSVNGFRMGSVILVPPQEWPQIFPLKIACAVVGTANLKKIELIENNRVVYEHLRWRGPANEMAFCYMDPDVTYYHRYYYVRVTQVDEHMAWSSPVFFDYIRPEDLSIQADNVRRGV